MNMPGSLWSEYGFVANPYSTDPIDPSSGGRQLLVGRATELALVSRQISSGASVVALEGDFGVGKTSLAASAAYDASKWRAQGGPLFLPIRTRLSLKADDTRESFERRAVHAVAIALVAAADSLAQEGRKLEGVPAVRDWLTSSQSGGWNVGLGASAVGSGGNVSAGRTRAVNTSAGFSETGFVGIVDSWLKLCFRIGRQEQ
jgi:hypothetical protein